MHRHSDWSFSLLLARGLHLGACVYISKWRTILTTAEFVDFLVKLFSRTWCATTNNRFVGRKKALKSQANDIIMSLDHNPQCSACKISNSLMWRRGTNGEVLCNSCHLKRVNSSIRTQRQSSKESKKLIARIKAGTRKGWNGKSGERSRGRRTLQKIKRKVLHIYWCWFLEWHRLRSMQCDNHLPSQWQNGTVKHQVLCGSFCEYWMQNESHFFNFVHVSRSFFVF